MNNSIWEIIANTPWWVFVLLVYLIRVGLGATRSRIVPVRRLLILPTIFIALSFVSMYNNMQLTFDHVLIWSAAFMIGSCLGWLQFKALKIKAVKNRASLYVPGTWSLLVIIIILFCVKYYYGYQNAIDPTKLQSNIWLFFAYGLFTGLFAGRVGYAVRCIKAGPYASDETIAQLK
jgi:hypothetical protein